MKKIKFVLGFILATTLSFSIKTIYAVERTPLTKNDLISLIVDGTERIVRKDTTIDEIKSWYGGEAKVETDSLYGGKAYSFYIGDKFDDYLYIETVADGNKIFSYGSTDSTYKTNTYSFDDDYPYNERNALYGCLLSDSGIVKGGVYYNKSAYLNGSSSKILKAYKDAFLKDQTKAMLNLNKHAVPMFNSIQRYYNNENGFVTFNEDYFYINQQFRDFGTNLQGYMYKMGYGNGYYSAIGTATKTDLSYSAFFCLNPLKLAGMAKSLKKTDFNGNIYAIWDYNYETKILAGSTYSPNCFDRADEVTLTSSEISKLGAGRQEYKEAINYFNRSSEMYKITSINDSAANLRAGELLQDKKEGITHYMNAIRVAAGLGRVNLDEEGFNIAQHLATVNFYRMFVRGLDMAHAPLKSETPEIDENFIDIASGKGKSWNSNLASSTMVSSTDLMIRHINLLIEDKETGRDKFTFGHRNRLLYPLYTRFGYGVSSAVGVVELNGGRDYDNILSAWPAADGITFMESLNSNKFIWTARFLSKYEVQNTTTAKVECLNTGEVWNFDKEEDTTTRSYQNLLDGEVLTSVSNKVALYDSTIEPRAGYVYVVTINGLKNTETGNMENYSYRTVFEYADESSYPSSLDRIKIRTDNLYEIKDRTGVYTAPIGRTLKLNLDIDTSVIDKKVTWTSSNPNVVSVTQDGTIYAYRPSEEQVTITVKFDGSNVTDSIVVMPYISLESVGLSEKSIDMEVETEENTTWYDICIETVPAEVTEILDVDWVISDKDTEYYLEKDKNGKYVFESPLNTDKNLAEYFEVDETSFVRDEKGIIRGIKLKAKKINKDCYDYTLKTYVTAMSDMYNDERFGGACAISVSSPITSVKSYINTSGMDEELDSSNVNEIVLKGNGPYKYKLTAKALPEDTTQEITNLTWSSNNENIATVDNEGNIEFHSTGTVVLERGGTKPGSYELNVTAPLKGIITSVDLQNKTLDDRYIKAFSKEQECIEEIIVTRSPSINQDKLIYTIIEGEDIATVNNGIVEFTGIGNVTIKVTSELNERVTSTIKFQLQPTVEDFKFSGSKIVNEDGEVLESSNEATSFLNIDFNKLSTNSEYVDENGYVVIDGYTADYKRDEDVAKLALYPKITYSVENGGEDIVDVDSKTGKLTVKKGGEAQIIASVPTPDGHPLEIKYTLISNKKSSENNIKLIAPSNVARVEKNESGEDVYYVYRGSSYIFKIEGDSSSNDKLMAQVKSTPTISEYVNYNVSDSNELEIKPVKAGTLMVELRLSTYWYEPKGENNESVLISNTSERNTNGPENSRFKINLVVLDYLKGDMNKDGYVNSIDASIVLDKFKNGGITIEDMTIGDMDNDGVLNSVDASMILDIFKNK